MKVDGNRFRVRRFTWFRRLLLDSYRSEKEIRVLDVGGTRAYWDALAPYWSDLPLIITIVNLEASGADDQHYRFHSGDARCMPDYPDDSFDIVHSNSVIEHVGQWSDMEAMASEIRRLAPRYFVQTPNLWFPIEPHFRSVFFALYPEAHRARKLLKRRHGFRDRAPDFSSAMREVQSVNLLDIFGMRALFPDANIRRERFLGLTKSLIAMRY